VYCLSYVIGKCFSKYKIEKLSNKYCVLALGKLGGEELNYSSDIDLIAFTDKNTLINKSIYYNQLITETIQLFIEQASSVTPNGFLYRIDFRLRPDGRNAPLCGSINQYLHYYEMRGEDWERQMLIKSGFISGSLNLYKKFTSFIERFIYPSSFRVSPLVQIKKLKSSIEKSHSNELNIKLLPGGIRDIEFSVQALQLLNGGKMPVVRSANTLNSIKLLSEKNLLSKDESKILAESYIFFRKIEHYLQLMNNAQTHTIPDSGELPHKLGIYLGFNTTTKFRKTLEDHRTRVSEVYRSITFDDSQTRIADSDEIVFSDMKRAANNIEFLKYGRGILAAKKFDALTTSLFENIYTSLIDYLRNSTAPDQILENFTRIIKSAQFPGIWYKEFTDQNYFRLFLKLCEYSQYSINLFAEDKYLRDLFLSRKCLEKIDTTSFSNLSTKEILFILSVQYTSGLVNSKDVNSTLSDFIYDKIKNLSSIFSEKKKWKDDYLIIAMGSLGTKEINFSSDIDLIFTVRDINNYPRIQNDFQEMLSELKNSLLPFEVDCRLRPEGKNSYLVWDLNSYYEYLKNRARVWEIQAFLKANFIAGSKAYYKT
jgi:[glutamine synthetase] adenylyltransferase / [glutamine synthetase]-adenylyl-L-tyrosine phosphorylase